MSPFGEQAFWGNDESCWNHRLDRPDRGGCDFYAGVAGWTPADVPMGDYADYCMHPPGDATPVAGICHARGANADLPPQWLIYITVADLDQSVQRCRDKGGKVLR